MSIESRRTRVILLLAFALIGTGLPAEGAVRRAFVTSSAGTGDLTQWPGDLDDGLVGIAAANRICQNVAAASSLSLPNPSLYRAWISDDGTDAYCNVLGFSGKVWQNCGQPALPPPILGPWRMSNGGTYFASSLGDLLDGTPAFYFPLARDENFAAVPTLDASGVWTGTQANGRATGSNCGDWTSADPAASGSIGTAFGTSDFWTYWTTSVCSEPQRLICLEAAAGDPLPLFWSPASLVFVTSQIYSADLGSNPEAGGQTGIAAGDAICRSRAAAAHLPAPQSFVAWLGDGVAEPASRITSTGPFKRIDGISIAGSRADLFDGTIASTIHQDESGAYIQGDGSFLSGADAFGHTLPNHCEGWTSSSAFDKRIGHPGIARDPAWADDGTTFSCTFPGRLACFSNVVTIFWDGFDYTGDTSRWSSVAP